MAKKMTRSEFKDYIINEVLAYRKSAAKTPDFFDSVTIAQALHETSWGQSELYLAFNNAFGYKAKPGEWDGKISEDYKSDEEVDGVVIKDVPSDFRWYDSVAESVADHANMMTSRGEYYIKTYHDAINAKTPQGQAHALTKKYAGDSRYGEKLIKIMDDNNLYQYDKEAKQEETNMAYIGIDIGHGKNSPARGGSGGWTGDEHSFNSKVAIRTKALLESMGHKVTFGVQNPNSNEVGLSPRTNYFNSQKVDVLVSIHANAHSNTTVNGVSAFYDRYGRGRDTPSLKLAKSIMNEYRNQGQVIWSTGEVPSYRGNWTDFHMNRESVMPSVLMELGFMTGNRDREYVFGSKQSKFVEDMAQGIARGVDKYFGGVRSTYNPQGLKETTPVEYVEPRLPFKKLEVGQTVTILDDKNSDGEYIWQWYDLGNNKLLKSGKQAELAGTTDEIVEVRDIDDVQHSKFAYKLKNYNSWILEEYLEEPREDWEKVEDKTEDEGLKEGQFVLNGVKYQVSEIK